MGKFPPPRSFFIFPPCLPCVRGGAQCAHWAEGLCFSPVALPHGVAAHLARPSAPAAATKSAAALSRVSARTTERSDNFLTPRPQARFLFSIFLFFKKRNVAAGGTVPPPPSRRLCKKPAAGGTVPLSAAGAVRRTHQLPSSRHSRCGRMLKTCHRHVFLTPRPRRGRGLCNFTICAARRSIPARLRQYSESAPLRAGNDPPGREFPLRGNFHRQSKQKNRRIFDKKMQLLFLAFFLGHFPQKTKRSLTTSPKTGTQKNNLFGKNT